MPAQVARQAGGGGGNGPTTQQMLDDIQAAGVTDQLLRALSAQWDVGRIWRAIYEQGHTAQTLADLLANHAPPQTTPPPKPQPAQASAPAAPAEPIRAGWTDAALASGGWTLFLGLVWLVNGVGTVIAVYGAVVSILPVDLMIVVSPLFGWIVALLAGVAAYFIRAYSARRGLVSVVAGMVVATIVTQQVLSQPITPGVLGVILGVIAHLTISKTELLYWGALLSWRIVPLIAAILADVLTSAQGLITIAYARNWAWITGRDAGALPANALSWLTPIGVFWRRLWYDPASGVARPEQPGWTGRALLTLIIVTAIALGAERAFRLVWRDWRATWAARPFWRSR